MVSVFGVLYWLAHIEPRGGEADHEDDRDRESGSSAPPDDGPSIGPA
jgi:hypothetical protein